MILAAAFDNGLALGLAALVLVYLVVVLVFPERF